MVVQGFQKTRAVVRKVVKLLSTDFQGTSVDTIDQLFGGNEQQRRTEEEGETFPELINA